MVQLVSNKWIRGLDLNSNPLAYVVGKDPYGGSRNATVIADECILTRQRMIGNRKGFDYFTKSTSAQIDGLWEYQNYIIQHQADATMYYGDNASGNRTQYSGIFTAPSGYRVDATVGRGSLFFSTTAGTMKLDAYTHTPSRSGLTKGLDTRVALTGTGAGFLGAYNQAAYVITWNFTDANNQLVRSDVSTSVIVTNSNQQTLTSLTESSTTATATTPNAHGYSTGDTILIAGATQTAYNGSVTITNTGTYTFTYTMASGQTSPATGTITCGKALNTIVTFPVPWDIPSGAYYEVWRTQTAGAAGGNPGDTCYLVAATLNSTAGGGIISYTDTTPDSTLLSATGLYTNSTLEGALQNNMRPPNCTSMCTYKDYGIFANTSIDHQMTPEMLATVNFVSGTSAITITAGSTTRTYTCGASENTSTNTWQLYTGGISNSLNIQNSTTSLCHVINCDASGAWYAEYASGPTANPGIFRIWARSPLSGQFHVTADSTTTGNQFTPTIPTSGSTVASSNDARANRLFYSKVSEPDHVPTLNYIDVGRLDQAILRVLPVRDACYVIKTDGVWYLSGLVAPFSLVELDSTCHCVAAATCVMLNNQVYMLANQGVVTISTSGVTIISVDIEPAIMQSALPLSNISTVAFGVGSEAARHYYLWLPTGSGDSYATQCYVYHTFITEWCHSYKPANAGIALNSNYTLYIASGKENALLKQRNNGDYTDYSDEQQSITVTGQTGLVVTATWANTAFTPTAGVTLHQSAVVAKVTKVAFVSGTTWNFTIDRTVSYSNGAATARMPIYAHVRCSPNALGEVGMTKQIYSVAFVADSNTQSQVTLEACTNQAPELQTFSIYRPTNGGWGSNPWGLTAWGDILSPVLAQPWIIDMPIPDITGEAVTGGWIHNVSQEQFVLAQVSVAFDNLAEAIETS
jgi:hypothetical protein